MEAGHTAPAASTPEQVAGEAKRKRRNRKRTFHATTVRRIQAKARERQNVWTAGGDQPNRTTTLTRELDELFDERRDEQKGTLRDPFMGRTSGASA